MSLIDWTRYVDAIYCLHFIPHQNRLPILKENLKYMNILESPIFHWYYSYPNNFDEAIIRAIKPKYDDYYNLRRNKVLNLMIAYHNMFREIQELGYKKILIIENDCRFIPNQRDLFIETLEHLPHEWDYIHFDKMNAFNTYLYNLKYGEWFHSNFTGGYWGNAFTMWSIKGINIAVKEIEKNLTMTDHILINRISPELVTLKRYVPKHLFVYQPDYLKKYDYFLDKIH